MATESSAIPRAIARATGEIAYSCPQAIGDADCVLLLSGKVCGYPFSLIVKVTKPAAAYKTEEP